MMRVTFDTNVLVSAFIAKHGRPASLMQLALTLETIELFLSNPILTEFEDVLMRRSAKVKGL
jgi:predicted nucleic acid-binding protein